MRKKPVPAVSVSSCVEVIVIESFVCAITAFAGSSIAAMNNRCFTISCKFIQIVFVPPKKTEHHNLSTAAKIVRDSVENLKSHEKHPSADIVAFIQNLYRLNEYLCKTICLIS